MILGDFVEALAEHTHPENAAPWDPVGLTLGDPTTDVSSIAVCHEVTEAVLGKLEKKPVDLLVTYHPLLFAPTHRLVAGRSPEARAFRLLRMNTALLVTHTDFDSAPGGAADALAHAFSHVNRVAVVPGSGSDFIDAAAEAADVLVTGDVGHHRTVRAADLGLAIVDPGHVATERPGVEALVALVGKLADTAVADLTTLIPQTWG